MKTRFIEVTDGFNWGKVMVGRFEREEWGRRSVVLPDVSLLVAEGWSSDSIIVLDLATCEGAAFRPGGFAKADLEKHQVWVCPLFEPFLEWLYRQDLGDLDRLPEKVTIKGPKALYGYRRPGPGHSTT